MCVHYHLCEMIYTQNPCEMIHKCRIYVTWYMYTVSMWGNVCVCYLCEMIHRQNPCQMTHMCRICVRWYMYVLSMWDNESMYYLHDVTLRRIHVRWYVCVVSMWDDIYVRWWERWKKWKKVELLSHVWPFATPQTVAYQAPPSMGFSRQECWSGLPFPSPGDLPDPGLEPRSPALQADALPSKPPGNLVIIITLFKSNHIVPPKYIQCCMSTISQ